MSVSAVPSPQLTTVEAIVPSGSDEVMETVTVWPVEAVVGDAEIVTTGARSEIEMVDVLLDAVEPLLSVTVTITAYVFELVNPVDV